MSCNFPVPVWQSRWPNGKGQRPLVFRQPNHFNQYVEFRVACGRCMACRTRHARALAFRAWTELEFAPLGQSCFITLTYNDEHLPGADRWPNGTLVLKDLQDFFKRLRAAMEGRGEYKWIPGEPFRPNSVSFGTLGGLPPVERKPVLVPHDWKLRYLACGEYGMQGNRAHYHALLFGVNFAEDWKQHGIGRGGKRKFTSERLSGLWGKGFVEVGDVTAKSCAYVAKYVLKKVGGPRADDHYEGRSPEFARWSLKPTLGHAWFMKYHGPQSVADECVFNGKQMAMPRAFDAFRTPEALAVVRAKRLFALEEAIASGKLVSPEELAVRDEVQRERASKAMGKVPEMDPRRRRSVASDAGRHVELGPDFDMPLEYYERHGLAVPESVRERERSVSEEAETRSLPEEVKLNDQDAERGSSEEVSA